MLEQRVPGSYDPNAGGNNFLYNLLGVEAVTVINAGDDFNAVMQTIAAELESKGRKGYIIPGGGSNALGALGYVACAHEIAAQSFEQGVAFDRIVVASGSCGTHSGLLVGVKSVNFDAPITGINVRRPARGAGRQSAEARAQHGRVARHRRAEGQGRRRAR